MTCQEQIGDIKFRDAQIRKANPSIGSINWKIKDVPFSDFNILRDSFSEKGDNRQFSTGELYFHAWINGGMSEGSIILITSVPVKRVAPIYEEL